jgi:hypothetical protein
MPVPSSGYALRMTAPDDGPELDPQAEILRDSEERIAEAVAGDAPSDAADEHRPSDEGV